jgi:putative spermidine/putrescine transport system ATP-binding protein
VASVEEIALKFLEIENLRKVYGAHTGVEHFDIAVERGEFVAFLGPSGCGKTTTLRMVAGFEQPTSGSIRIEGRDILGLRPNQRKMGMVFQAYALFPNMTVAQNVGFGLKVAKRPDADVKKRVAEMLTMIKLSHLADRYPYQLSGGQQQRVALARALATKPQLLLLDEPLSALDAKIRAMLRSEIRELQRNLGITTIFVTHDQEEALAMSDRIVVMNEGRVEQIGSPFEVYNRPRSRFVASFLGTLNVLKAKVADPERGAIRIDDHEVRLAGPIAAAKAGDTRAVALRPEAAALGTPATGDNVMRGTIEDVSFQGAIVRITVRFQESLLSLDTFNNSAHPPPERGAPASVCFAPADLQLLEGTEV